MTIEKIIELQGQFYSFYGEKTNVIHYPEHRTMFFFRYGAPETPENMLQQIEY